MARSSAVYVVMAGSSDNWLRICDTERTANAYLDTQEGQALGASRIMRCEITTMRDVDSLTLARTKVLHITKDYALGVGHIEQRGTRLLVSFYGRRVRQVWTGSLQEARFALRRMAT